MKSSYLFVALLFALASCGGGNNSPDPDPGNGNGGGGDPVDPDKVWVRQDVYPLNANDPIITGYQKAITAMQALPDTDPTSWTFQAAIHGTYASGSNPVWNQCQHGSFFFLSWHRMYLYYFERICRRYSEDPEWALPYWNYSNASDRALPAVFRDNAAGNPLYISQRRASINGGAQLSPSTVALDCLDFIPFTGTTVSLQSFGGQTIPGPQHFFGGTGALENIPHNQVHVAIGGWMQDPNTAAQDPIFWLHHCNIDRLLNTWLALGDGREITDNATWRDEVFQFYDENGTLVELTGAEVVNSAAQLNYRYDTDPSDQPLLASTEGTPDAAPESQPETDSQTNKTMDAGEQEGKLTLAEAKQSETRFTHQPLTVAVPMLSEGASLKSARSGEGAEGKGTYLTVEGVKFDKIPEQSVAVFINVPEGQQPDLNGVHYVGMMTFFGVAHHAMHADHGDGGANFVFDISDKLDALEGAGVDLSNIRVTFDMTTGVEPMEGFEEAEGAESEPVGAPRFDRVTIQVF